LSLGLQCDLSTLPLGVNLSHVSLFVRAQLNLLQRFENAWQLSVAFF
jgi:hypothetical protein